MATTRRLSIDIFRGLTIFTMVFVNDLAGVVNIPAWMKHAATHADTMTFVDVVFPAFLFIVGMAIPLSIAAREKKGESLYEMLFHVLIRTSSLIIIGVYMVNSEEMNASANLLPKWLWDSLLYISVILIWNNYPKETNKRRIYAALKIIGMVILVILWYSFRKGEIGELRMTHSWWGILGLIGWAYLITVLLYLMFRDQLFAYIGLLGLMIVMVLGLKGGELSFPSWLTWLNGQAGHFSHAALCIAGLSTTLIFKKGESYQTHIRWFVVFACMCAIAAFMVRPYFGISKNLATPAWVLYCITICLLLFSLIYWLSDIKGIHRWAAFLKPAGENPLLTYILPYLFYALIGYGNWPEVLNSGIPGVMRSIIFSLFILAIASILTRWNIRLKL